MEGKNVPLSRTPTYRVICQLHIQHYSVAPWPCEWLGSNKGSNGPLNTAVMYNSEKVENFNPDTQAANVNLTFLRLLCDDISFALHTYYGKKC